MPTHTKEPWYKGPQTLLTFDLSSGASTVKTRKQLLSPGLDH